MADFSQTSSFFNLQKGHLVGKGHSLKRATWLRRATSSERATLCTEKKLAPVPSCDMIGLCQSPSCDDMNGPSINDAIHLHEIMENS